MTEDKEATIEAAVQWLLAQLAAQGSPATEDAYEELSAIVGSALDAIAAEDPELLQSLTAEQIADVIQQVVRDKTA